MRAKKEKMGIVMSTGKAEAAMKLQVVNNETTSSDKKCFIKTMPNRNNSKFEIRDEWVKTGRRCGISAEEGECKNSPSVDQTIGVVSQDKISEERKREVK